MVDFVQTVYILPFYGVQPDVLWRGRYCKGVVCSHRLAAGISM